MSTPCTELRERGGFPLVPEIMGNLIPMNYNVWMGTNPRGKGSSSRLHHDFHDNLYVLLRGRKRFLLFSPADAFAMSTVGDLKIVHPNGRICYSGEVTDADGVDPGSRKAMEASLEHERAAVELAEAEEALKNLVGEEGRKGMEEVLREAEERMEETMDIMVEAEGGEGGEGWDSEGEESKEGEGEGKGEDEQSDPTPSNFSQVYPSLPHSELQRRFPSYVSALSRSTTATLTAGDILYLPAGWFHEVTSLSAEDEENGGEEESILGKVGKGRCGHMAFNFWFHPPDGGEFEKPYRSEFWRRDWEERLEAMGNNEDK